jgi:hypothetical protein
MQDDSQELTNTMHDFIQEVCDKVGPRPFCTKAERDGAEFIQSKYAELCKDTKIEDFYTHPAAYKMAFRIPMVLYILALIFLL